MKGSEELIPRMGHFEANTYPCLEVHGNLQLLITGLETSPIPTLTGLV